MQKIKIKEVEVLLAEDFFQKNSEQSFAMLRNRLKKGRVNV